MKRRTRLGLFAAALIIAPGCCLFNDYTAPAGALTESFAIISDEYLTYVDADPALDADSKQVRHTHVEQHRALLEDLSHAEQ